MSTIHRTRAHDRSLYVTTLDNVIVTDERMDFHLDYQSLHEEKKTLRFLSLRNHVVTNVV